MAALVRVLSPQVESVGLSGKPDLNRFSGELKGLPAGESDWSLGQLTLEDTSLTTGSSEVRM